MSPHRRLIVSSSNGLPLSRLRSTSTGTVELSKSKRGNFMIQVIKSVSKGKKKKLVGSIEFSFDKLHDVEVELWGEISSTKQYVQC